MRKTEIDLLNYIELAEPIDPLLKQPAKTAQQNFLLAFAAIHFLQKGVVLPSMENRQLTTSGSFSDTLLLLKHMKYCMQAKILLDNPQFHVLQLLVPWMQGLQQLKQSQQPHLLTSVLYFESNQLPVNHFQELIVYFGYVSRNLQMILNSNAEFAPDDLLLLLGVMLPRIHYNIVIPKDQLGKQSKQQEEVLFFNESIQFFIRTQPRYRSLVRKLFRVVLELELKPSQAKQLMERAFKYFLLFFKNQKMCVAQIFMASFEKTPQNIRFALRDQLTTFFKIANKIGDGNLYNSLTQKWPEASLLLQRFEVAKLEKTKDEVNPYSSLGIKQKIQVKAGAVVILTIQIFHPYSLLYFWLSIQHRDITMRITYLGDFQSKVSVLKMLAEQKLTDSIKSTFVAAKRGIYQLQLDNSRSWINSKNISFEYVVLSQYQHSPNPIWLDKLLQIGQNEENEDQDQFVQIKPASINALLEGNANFSLANGIFTLFISSKHDTYELQTSQEERLIKRLKKYAQKNELKWIVNPQARGWLRRNNYSHIFKNILISNDSKSEKGYRLDHANKFSAEDK